MSAGDALLAGRDLAEELMIDAGELRGPDVKGPLGPDRTYTPTPGPLKYTGKAKMQTTDTIGDPKSAAERVVMRTRFELHLPMSAPAAAVDDVWTMTSSVLDPELAGRRFRVVSLLHKSFMTARRITVEEVQS